MSRTLVGWFLLHPTLILAGCGLGPTPADTVVFERARSEFSQSFRLDPRQDTYIEARYLIADDCPEEKDAVALFRVLFLEEDGSRREDSNFTYLNVRKTSGAFCYQLFLDPGSKRIERSHQAYY